MKKFNYKRKKYQPYKLYIPENLNIDELILNNPLPVGIHRDQLVYILHLINSIPANINDFNFVLNRGFTPILKQALANRIHGYRKCMDYLIANSIIKEGTNYVPTLYSRGIKFRKKYRTKVAPIYITNQPLIKSIVTKKHSVDIVAMDKLKFLIDNFNSYLTIDMIAVKAYLDNDLETSFKKYTANQHLIGIYSHCIDEIVMMGYNAKFINASNLNNKDKVKIDTTAGRLHSSLVRLKKELRPYVKYADNTLCNIDLVNSQPLLSTILLDADLFISNGIHDLIAKYNPNFNYDSNMNIEQQDNLAGSLIRLIKHNSKKEDVIAFKQHVHDGAFYEEFGNILKRRDLLPVEIKGNKDQGLQSKAIRKYAKKAVFESFFSKPNAHRHSNSIKAFKECFPHVYQIFSLVKQGKGEYNTLACVLQRFESDLILHKACTKIHELYPNVLLYTIHDSIVTTLENQHIVKEILVRIVAEVLNVEPKINVEMWQ